MRLQGCSRWQSSAPPPGSQLARLAGLPGSAMAETVAIKAARVKKVVEVVNCMLDWFDEVSVAEKFGEDFSGIYTISCSLTRCESGGRQLGRRHIGRVSVGIMVSETVSSGE